MIGEQGNLSRRGFLERSLVGAGVAAGVPAWFARRSQAAYLEAEPARRRTIGPNDTIRMGAIGTGSRGIPVAKAALRQNGVEFVAVCDVDANHRRKGAEELGGEDKVEQYNDFRELLDRDDIDAVTIVTPDHWHALIAIEAMKKGKQVYCEKPLTLTIDEGKSMVQVARSNDTIFQTGSQQRSEMGGKFRLACELVRNGRLGKISTIETRIGANPQAGPFNVEAPPSELDWNLWLGPTPYVGYIKERCHYEFRWWFAYSGGKMTDWGAHHNDIAQWALGMDGSGPVAVEVLEKTPAVRLPNCYNWYKNFRVRFEYADGTEVLCQSGGDNGVKLIGEEGWIFVSRGEIEASDPRLLEEPLPEDAEKLYTVTNSHMGNFIDCVRSGERPICDVEIGHRSVTVCHLGNIAMHMDRRLEWDPTTEQFVNDSAANAMLSRPMRAPWKIEV